MTNVNPRDIAVIGYSCRFADADNVDEFWANLVAGKASFKPVPEDRWNHESFYSDHSRKADKTYAKSGAFIDDVSSFPAFHFGIAPRRVETMDPQHRMVLDAVRVALQDAGLENGEGYDPDMVGTFLGVSTSEYANLTTSRTMAMMMNDGQLGDSEDAANGLAHSVENVAPISAFSMTGILLNMAAANVAHQWKFKGPAYTVDAACASSLVAIHDGITNIRAGICDIAIAGGVYANLTPSTLVGFSRIGAISKSGVCRPFDENADGFVQGDGVGIVVLKSLEKALADGDRIHAVIKGSGINNDGDTSGPMAPAVEGQADVIRRAQKDAGIDPTSIGYVQCHGTATKVGDPVEVTALREVLGEDGEAVHIGSVKAHIGHTMSAAGVAGLLHAILSVENGVVTPVPGFESPNPKLELESSRFNVPTEPVAWAANGAPRRAGVSAFGFGGTNCHMIVEQPPQVEPAADVERPQLVVISAENRQLLAEHAAEVALAIHTHEYSLSDVAFTLNTKRKFEAARLALVAQDARDLIVQLNEAAERLATSDTLLVGPNTLATPTENEVSPVTFMFPGQGAQRPQLMRDVYDQYEGFRTRLDALTAVVDTLDLPLLHYIYPDLRDVSVDEETAAAELTATEVCQPAMAALGLALAGWLQDEFGIKPDFTIGHSLGEFVAAAVGGLLASEDALKFVAKRGQLMAELELDDYGSMAAVRADESKTQALIGDHNVVVANVNYPQQTVVSGPTDAIDAFVADLESKDVKVTKLNVSHAFHSPVVEPIAESLRAVVEGLSFQEPNATVVSAITKSAYNAANATETFVKHATSAVDFIGALEACSEGGSRTFVEVGAGTTLTRFANGTLDRKSHHARTFVSRDADENLEFMRTLGAMIALGYDVDLSVVTPQGNLVTLPATKLEQQSYWIVRDKKQPLAIASDEAPKKEAVVATNDSNDSNAALVALFQQQNAILAEHARIMATQTAMLTGQAPPDLNLQALTAQAAAVPTVAAPAPTAAPAPVEEPVAAAAPSHDFEAIVLETVAEVSAFPKEALKMDQQLATELGFDSLMFVDLGTALQKAIPELGAIPQDAFSMETRIKDVVTFLETQVAKGPVAEAAVAKDETLRRYEPTLVARELGFLPGEPPFRAGSTVAVVADQGGLAQKLVDALASTNAKFAYVEGDKLPKGATSLLYLAGLDEKASAKDLLAGKLTRPNERLRSLAAQLHGSANGTPDAVVVITDNTSPLQLGLTAIAKSLSREWPRTLVRTIRMDAKVNPATLAKELHNASQDLEVVYDQNGRNVVALTKAPFETQGQEPKTENRKPITKDDTVVFTGASRGIGAKIAIELAKRTKASLIVAGRTAEADLGDEAKANLKAMRDAGSNVEYVAWDVSVAPDKSVAKLLKSATVAIHSAGLIRDREIQAKTAEDFETVTAVKVDGLVHLTQALNLKKLSKLVVFSSWAGRFGNRGQADYAAANEVMGALASSLATDRLQVKVIDWPAWETSDMVQSIPESVREAMRQQGVTFINDEDGVNAFFDELQTSGIEALYGVDLPSELRTLRSRWGLSTETHPYLADHTLREKPVLPFASAMDYIAITAQSAIGNGPFEIRNLTLYRGVDVDEPVSLHVKADCRVNGDRFADVEIKCEKQGKTFVAYGGNYIAGRPQMPEISVRKQGVIEGAHPDMPLDKFYAQHAFHGPSIAAIERVEETGDAHLVGWVKTSTPAELVSNPIRKKWAIDPRVVDGAMQLVLYWLQAKKDMAAFPTSFDSYVQIQSFPTDGLIRTTMVLHELDDQKVIGSVLFEDADGNLLATMSRLQARVFDLAVEENDAGMDIPEELWKITAFPEVEALSQRLQMAELIGLRNPYFVTHDGVAKNKAVIEGKEMVNFSSYNYLGFSGHPAVSGAAKEAVDRFGTSVSASRLASGQIPLHQELEEEIADFVGVDAALVFSAGHATNESVIGHLFNEGDLIVHDSLAHNSILTGCALSGAKRLAFKHNDYDDLERILKQLRGSYKKVGIMIEGVYSMDGDIPDLPKFIELKKKYKCLLYVDEAHSVGTIGPRGAGVADYFGLDAREVDCWMGTLSKSFASCGGYVAASKELIEYLKYTVPGFIFSAGISPANSAAALASVRLIKQHPEVPQQLQARSEFFLQACKKRGIDTGLSKDSAVVPCIVGNSMDCLKLSERLAERGINVQPIVYPAVDDNESRLRFFLSSTHTEEELEFTAQAIEEELTAIRSGAAAE